MDSFDFPHIPTPQQYANSRHLTVRHNPRRGKGAMKVRKAARLALRNRWQRRPFSRLVTVTFPKNVFRVEIETFRRLLEEDTWRAVLGDPLYKTEPNPRLEEALREAFETLDAFEALK